LILLKNLRSSFESLRPNGEAVEIMGDFSVHAERVEAFLGFFSIIFLHKVCDISNNLKIYRADILKNLEIQEHHFAANAETGLKPIRAGYRIKEVSVSWINRTVDMGGSSFRTVRVAPRYARALLRIFRSSLRTRLLPSPFVAARQTSSVRSVLLSLTMMNS